MNDNQTLVNKQRYEELLEIEKRVQKEYAHAGSPQARIFFGTILYGKSRIDRTDPRTNTQIVLDAMEK